MTNKSVNKIALVTGGNRGIGRNIALSLGRAGTDVVLTYRSNKDEASDVVREIRALGRRSVALRLDLERICDLDEFIEKLSQNASEHVRQRPA